MKVNFCGITELHIALEAVKKNGDALQYVLNFELFIKIAKIFNIQTTY